jgi:hypothetical protein
VTSFTVHVKDGAPLQLVPERFSLGGALFGPLWLLFVGAWIPAILLGCAWVAAVLLVPGAMLPPVALALTWFAGLCGRDMRRWSLARRGWRAPHVVVARSEEEALERLLRFHPWLAAGELKRSAA